MLDDPSEARVQRGKRSAEFRSEAEKFQLTFRSMRCLAVVKFATEELTTAKYGCSDD
jgi:hypothetical protein